jgi:hypothetical protein
MARYWCSITAYNLLSVNTTAKMAAMTLANLASSNVSTHRPYLGKVAT